MHIELFSYTFLFRVLYYIFDSESLLFSLLYSNYLPSFAVV